jgi:hypothetical protein
MEMPQSYLAVALRMVRIAYVVLFVFLIVPQPASAESHKIPSIEAAKASLLEYWEQTIKQDPSTRLFETTDEPGVYNIDTTVLPYKGRVKVLNLVVDVYKPVGNYDSGVVYGGVVETKLLDAPDIPQLQPFSFNKWQRMGWFDYDSKTSRWFPFNSWDEHFPIKERGKKRAVNGV